VLVVGLVEEFQANGHAPPLFCRGAFEHLRDPVAAQRGSETDREILVDLPELW
jgi:hypothetical protein